MTEPWSPDPEPSGSLEPPRRRPPTAVGVATPPPPRGPEPRYVDGRATRRRRLASAFVGCVLTATAASLATVGSAWPAILSTGFGAMGGAFLYRAFRTGRAPGGGARVRLAAVGRRLGLKRRRAA